MMRAALRNFTDVANDAGGYREVTHTTREGQPVINFVTTPNLTGGNPNALTRATSRSTAPYSFGPLGVALLTVAGSFAAVNASAEADSAAFAASPYAVTIPRGGATAVELHAPANTRCVLGAMHSPSGQGLAAISDARGIVRYFVSVNSTARAGVLATLECTGSKTHTLTGLTLTPGAPAPRGTALATGRPVTLAALATTARFGVLPGTPAGFDVTTASAAQLAQLHYPPRPDAQHDPMGYAIWRKEVTTPGAYVPTVPVPIPSGPNRMFTRAQFSIARAFGGKVKPEGVTSRAEPTSWQCGSSVFEFDSLLQKIHGNWNVPSVFGYFPGVSTSSTTVALNGVSEGTEQDAYFWPSFGVFTSYYAWYQVDTGWSASTRYGFNLPIGPGDGFTAEIASSDGLDSNPMDFSFWDSTNNQGGNVLLAAPDGLGYGAQWLEERQSPLPLALFTPVAIHGYSYAVNPWPEYDPDGSVYNWWPKELLPYDDLQNSLQMTSTGSSAGHPMCNSSTAGTFVNMQFVSSY